MMDSLVFCRWVYAFFKSLDSRVRGNDQDVLFALSIGVGNRQFLRGIERDDLRPFGVRITSSSIRAAESRRSPGNTFPRRTPCRPSVRSARCNELRREMSGRSCRPRPRPWQKLRPNASISLANPMSFAAREGECDLAVRAHAWLQELDGAVHPFPRLSVRRRAGPPLPADVERAVVAGAVPHERLDDVEECLFARADQPIGEVVRMRAAALARHGVDRLDASDPVVEALGGKRTISFSWTPGFSASAMCW